MTDIAATFMITKKSVTTASITIVCVHRSRTCAIMIRNNQQRTQRGRVLAAIFTADNATRYRAPFETR